MQNHREHAAHSVVETFAVCLMSGLGVLHGSSTQRKIQLHAARMIFLIGIAIDSISMLFIVIPIQTLHEICASAQRKN